MNGFVASALCLTCLMQPNLFVTNTITQTENMQVPDINSSFKSWMDYRTITNEESEQWKMQQNATTDENGLRKYDDMYMVALGTYYSEVCGEEFYITLDTGECLKCITGDIKNDNHTDALNQYVEINGNVVEFIIDSDVVDKSVLITGDISSASDKFVGNVKNIEKINTG